MGGLEGLADLLVFDDGKKSHALVDVAQPAARTSGNVVATSGMAAVEADVSLNAWQKGEALEGSPVELKGPIMDGRACVVVSAPSLVEATGSSKEVTLEAQSLRGILQTPF